MSIAEFLLARIAEDETAARDQQADAMTGHRWKSYPPEVHDELQSRVLARTRRGLAECAAKRRIIELHHDWPVLVDTPPSLEQVGTASTDEVTFRMTQRIAWLTQQQYRDRFGTEPPTAPMIAALAAVYADHPDYDPEWTPRR